MKLDRRRALGLLAAAGGGAALSCAGGRRRPQAPPRLVLLYATCSLNASYLGAYGGPAGLTPHLDRLAAGSALLEAQHSEAGQSGVAYASLLSGVQADRHGVFDHPSPINPELDLLSGTFAKAGWETHFWDGHAMASASLGFAKGVPPEHIRQRPLLEDDEDFAELMAGLAAAPERRALVMVNFTATHMKYTANPRLFRPEHWSPAALPEHFRESGLTPGDLEESRRLLLAAPTVFALCDSYQATLSSWGLDQRQRATFGAAMEYLYRCAVHRLDELLGHTLHTLDQHGLTPHSVVAFTADHGETLLRPGSYFAFSHGFQLAPEVLRVPLLIRAPAVAPARHRFVSRSIDLLPTLAGLAGVPVLEADQVAGEDLSPVLRGRARAPRLSAFSHTAMVHPNIVKQPEYRSSTLHRLFPARDPELMWTALRRDGLFVKRTRPPGADGFHFTAFDLVRDPGERENLFSAADPRHRQAAAELEAYAHILATSWHRRQPGRGLDEEQRIEMLETLGYL